MIAKLSEIWMAIRDVGTLPTVSGASYADCLGLVNRGREGREGVGRKYGVGVLVVGVEMPEEIPRSQPLYAKLPLPFSNYVRQCPGPAGAGERYHSLYQGELVVPSSDQRMIGYSMISQAVLPSYLLILFYHHLP